MVSCFGSRIAEMLPDFSELKAEIAKLIDAKLRASIRSKNPVMAEMRRYTQHEGRKLRYEQMPDYNKAESEFEAISTKVLIEFSEVPNLVGLNLEKKLNEIADSAASGVSKSMYRKIDDSCEKAGTAMHANGQPMSPEMMLEMMDRVEMSFDHSGNPTTTFVFHPNMLSSFKQVTEKIDNDPELHQRHTEILRRQREAWATRESNRKLVD
jgi:hypothetical protein